MQEFVEGDLQVFSKCSKLKISGSKSMNDKNL